ncbi:MAG: hypothetical protein AAFY65_16825 [Pseudomonadota bacterium]
MFETALSFLVVVVLTPLVAVLVDRSATRLWTHYRHCFARPTRACARVIYPSRTVYGGLGTVLVTYGLGVGLAPGPFWTDVAAGLAVVFGGLLMMCLHRDYAIGWTTEALRGPSSFLRLPGDGNVTTIALSEITQIGTDGLTCFYARAADGRVIRWSRFHVGWPDLVASLALARPDLAPLKGA